MLLEEEEEMWQWTVQSVVVGREEKGGGKDEEEKGGGKDETARARQEATRALEARASRAREQIWIWRSLTRLSSLYVLLSFFFFGCFVVISTRLVCAFLFISLPPGCMF